MSKKPVRVAVTGAAGQIGYALLFRIASGEMLGKDQPVILQLLEIPDEKAQKALKGVMMELDDCAFPLLAGMEAHGSAETAFQDTDYALLVGARPRGPGMERADLLAAKIGAALDFKNQVLVKIYNRKALDPEEMVETLLLQAEGFAHRIADTRLLLNNALEAGETVLLEGSQGTLLDVDHGTYPFVTSSNPTAGGAAVGSGIGPTRITTVLGILKAYTTRVGSGPFPTELFDESGEYLSKTGGEIGVTTGRRRRCGWFDAVIARYATRVNGITDYFLTKLDVLSSLETVPVCVGYTIDGKRTDDMPMTQSDIARAVPVYEELPGWWEDISAARQFDDLPAKARDYVLRLEELAGAPVSCIGVGPGRDQTIVRRDVLAPR